MDADHGLGWGSPVRLPVHFGERDVLVLMNRHGEVIVQDDSGRE